MPIISTGFSNVYNETMLPALNEAIFNTYGEQPSRIPLCFNVQSSTRGVEQDTTMAGLGLFRKTPETAPVEFDQPFQGFKQTYKHDQYSLAFLTSHVAMEDDQWGIVKDTAANMGHSAFDTREVQGASVFNNGFDTNFLGPDGKVLFATDHPQVGGGGTQSNTSATSADLSVPAIEVALAQFRRFVDYRGKRINVRPETLMVAPELEFAGTEILGGTWKSDTANHTINAFLNRPDGLGSFKNLISWSYLTDPDAWFILGEASKLKLKWWDREKFNVVHDIDFLTRSLMHAAWMRFSFGFSDYLGTYGSAGA